MYNWTLRSRQLLISHGSVSTFPLSPKRSLEPLGVWPLFFYKNNKMSICRVAKDLKFSCRAVIVSSLQPLNQCGSFLQCSFLYFKESFIAILWESVSNLPSKKKFATLKKKLFPFYFKAKIKSGGSTSFLPFSSSATKSL